MSEDQKDSLATWLFVGGIVLSIVMWALLPDPIRILFGG